MLLLVLQLMQLLVLALLVYFVGTVCVSGLLLGKWRRVVSTEFHYICRMLANKQCWIKLSVFFFITCFWMWITTESPLPSATIGYKLAEIFISLYHHMSAFDLSMLHSMRFSFSRIPMHQCMIKRYISHRVIQSKIKPGDHIYSWRFAFVYSHHGIYIGGGFVMHYTSAANVRVRRQDSCLDHYVCRPQPSEGGVALCCVNCFKGSGSLYSFQYDASPFAHIFKLRGGISTTAKSDLPEIVVRRAAYLMENGFGRYHIAGNNCEDFSLYCKTGLTCPEQSFTGRSGQVSSWVNVLWMAFLSLIQGSFWEAAFLAVVVRCLSRYVADIGVRDDMVKVQEVEHAIDY